MNEKVTESIYEIEGRSRLSGEVRLSGAKNAVLPLIAAACLGEEPTILENVPVCSNDVQVLVQLLQIMGAAIEVDTERGTIQCARGTLSGGEVPDLLSRRIRHSLLCLGLFAALRGSVHLPAMGGDDFDRKHDLHLMGLSELGAVVKENEKGIYLEATHLVGKVIDFHTPTLTGSANIMIAAATADGTTIINNVDSRPEIDQLATLLSLLGAETISKNRIVRIRGLKKLHGGVTIKVMPDRLEAVTFMIAAGMTESSIVIRDFNLSCIPAEAHALRSTGIELWEREGDLFVSGMSQKRGFHIVTAPYPGLDSDTQPLFSALALTVPDVSLIDELRMSNRFKYMEQMKGFGGNIGIYGNTAIIQGGHPLIGTNVKALDIRGGAAYVLIGLAAMGFTRISNVYQIERGYDRFVEKLRAIGVSIKKHETLI